jgi:hypothetical protein
MISSSLGRLFAFVGVSLLMAPQILADQARPGAPAKGSGDMWEVTSRVSIEGMQVNVPAQTQRVCSAKEWKAPPGGTSARGKCAVSDFKTVGSKVTWKLACEGPPAMSGVGEITRSGGEAYAGFISFVGQQGVMKVVLDGRRVSDCVPEK